MSYQWEMRLYVRKSNETQRDINEVMENVHRMVDRQLQSSNASSYEVFVSKGRDETYVGIHLTSDSAFALFGAGIGVMDRQENRAKTLLPSSLRRFVSQAEILRLEAHL